MILVDTSVWIEFLRQNNEPIETRLLEELSNGRVIACGPIFGELLQGTRNLKEEEIIINLWEDLPKANEEALFFYAGKLSFEYKLNVKGVGLIDAAILTLAISRRLELWTLDKKLQEAAKQLKINSFE